MSASPTEVAVRQPEAASLLNIIASAAENPNVDVAKLSALLDMQDRVLKRQAEAEFNAALARMTKGMPRVKKNGTIKLVKDGVSKGEIPFARWEDMDTILRPLMEAEGFTLSFNSEQREGGGAVVLGTLLHSGGHSRTVSMGLALDTGAGRNNLQAMGSTLSYGKRYCAEMLFNIVREGVDDDGQRGGTVYASPDQVKQIEGLLISTRSDRVKFLRHYGIDDVTELTAEKFIQALNALNQKAAGTKP